MNQRTVNELAVDAVAVTKRYGELVAVDDLSLQVASGEVYGILGPNGAGKTTFLRMLFGLIRPDAGTIRVFGKTWAEAGVGVLDGVAGFVESPRFYPYLTGRQNLDGLMLLDGTRSPGKVAEVLDVVELTGRENDKVGGYSYGMRQRLGVAASLLRDPRLLVLDEPANGLDPGGIRDMRALVKRLADSGLTVLLSSHHMEEVEEICDNVTIMRRGSVAFHGTIADLRSMAPDPGHVLSTTDDGRALVIAHDHHPSVTVEPDSEGSLVATGPPDRLSAYVADLVRSDVDLLAFTPTQTPLEALFFMLTDTHPEAASSRRESAVRRADAGASR
jgi:ABC-2 type transport system ATP-binding protein